MRCLILTIKRRPFLALQNLQGCLSVFSFDRLPKSVESLAAIYRKWRKLFPCFFLNLNSHLWEYESVRCLILKIKRRPFLTLQNLWGCLSVFSFNRLPKSAESLTAIDQKCWPGDQGKTFFIHNRTFMVVQVHIHFKCLYFTGDPL